MSSSQPLPIEARLRASLEEARAQRLAHVDALLDRIERLGEWGGATLPADLRAHLAEQRAERAVELAEALLSWRRSGGRLRLEAADASEYADPLAPGCEPVPLVVEPSRAVAEPRPAPPPLPEPELRDDDTDRVPVARSAGATPANVASADALASLKAHVEGGGTFRVQAPPADWPRRLAEHLRELLPAKDPEADLVAVSRVVEAVEKWRVLPPEVQAPLVGLLAARLRVIQEVPGFLGDKRIDHAFGTLSAYMKRARPGFVYGLARFHMPVRGSWDADAEAMYDRLAAMVPTPTEAEPNLQRHLDGVEALVKELEGCPAEVRSAVLATLRRQVLAGFAIGIHARHPRLVRMLSAHADDFEGPEFRTLRRAIRDEADEARAEAEEETGAETDLPADWAWWPFTRDARALIIGGDPREPSRLRLERSFQFAELEWVGAEYKRNNLLGVRERVRAGKTDLVLLLTRFTGHDADQIIIPACREMAVPFVCVQHGYGVVRVRHAIERFLDPNSRQ